MLRIMKVTGESLSPFINQGDYVLVDRLPGLFKRLKKGDAIVFRHPVYGTMIKKVEEIRLESGEAVVSGTHPESLDSRQFGPIPLRWLVGRVAWRIQKPD